MTTMYGLVAAILFSFLSLSSAFDNGVALTPPMGFNSYMAPALRNEHGLRRAASFLRDSGLRDLGYAYINTDEGWELKFRDGQGNLLWNDTLYPSSLPSFIDELHNMGFKFGIYGAASGVTCGEDPGQLYNEVKDAHTYASWGVDFIKSDNCASYALDSSVRYRALRDAVNATGRTMVLSIEPFSINPDPAQSSEVGNMWRTGVDIEGTVEAFLDRADITDKWAPLAGPSLGWNDPDMINVMNPPQHGTEKGLTLGENRMYFSLWALMKAPLLLSTDLITLSSEVVDIISNPKVIAINQDVLGIPARKIEVDGESLSWLVGVEDCSFPVGGRRYSRNVASDEAGPKAGPGSPDTRIWTVFLVQQSPPLYGIQNDATRRCLDVQNMTSVVLQPCNKTKKSQLWEFDMGITTVTSITNAEVEKALALSDSLLYSGFHGKDNASVSDLAYGLDGVILVEPHDQEDCISRWCENYQPEQMWYYSPMDGLLRHSLYTSSMNHVVQDGKEDGYVLTRKVPTFRHHCLAHVLSTGNAGTSAGSTEVWGGPLEGGDFIVGLMNRGSLPSNITAHLDLLWEVSGVDAHPSSSFSIEQLWKGHSTVEAMAGVITMEVEGHDISLVLLIKKSFTLIDSPQR